MELMLRLKRDVLNSVQNLRGDFRKLREELQVDGQLHHGANAVQHQPSDGSRNYEV